MAGNSCDFCEHYLYDEEDDVYYCDVSLDEDEMERFLTGQGSCSFYKAYDEYKMVEKQN